MYLESALFRAKVIVHRAIPMQKALRRLQSCGYLEQSDWPYASVATLEWTKSQLEHQPVFGDAGERWIVHKLTLDTADDAHDVTFV